MLSKAPSLGSLCTWEIDERTGSAATGGGGGGERRGSGIELCAFSQKVEYLDRRYLLARVIGDQTSKHIPDF